MLASLPQNLKVNGDLNLYGCKDLKSLPQNLEVKGNLTLEGCSSLKSLPSGLCVGKDLDASNVNIRDIPKNIRVGGRIKLPALTCNGSLLAKIIDSLSESDLQPVKD
jgi:hypothetical protein